MCVWGVFLWVTGTMVDNGCNNFFTFITSWAVVMGEWFA